MTNTEAIEWKRCLTSFVQNGEKDKAVSIFQGRLTEVLERYEDVRINPNSFEGEMRAVLIVGLSIFDPKIVNDIIVDCLVKFCRGHPERSAVFIERTKV